MSELRDVFDSGTVVLIDSTGIADDRSLQVVTNELEYRLEEAGDFEAREAGDGGREIFHLVRELFVDATGGFVDCRANQVLKHLLILAGEDVGFDADVNQLLLAIHAHYDHAAARGGFHSNGIHLTLNVFLDLFQPGEHLLESVDFHQDSSWLRFTSVILPPNRRIMDFTNGSRSN